MPEIEIPDVLTLYMQDICASVARPRRARTPREAEETTDG